MSALTAVGSGVIGCAHAATPADTSIGAIATAASRLILNEKSALRRDTPVSLSPRQTSTYTFNISPTQTTLIAGLVEYNPSTCVEVSAGTWTVNTAPRHGTTTIGTLQGTLSNGSCPGTMFTFGTISYTPTDSAATTDDFAATWTSPDYNEPFDFNLLLPHVTFVSQDITTNSIIVDPEPAGLKGSLTIVATGDSNSPTVATQTVSGGGTVALSYGETAKPLPPSHYTSLTATWVSIGGGPAATITVTGTTTVNFTALGLYENTQYNIPAEAQCTGAPSPVTLWSITKKCVSRAGNYKTDFISQTLLNGTGAPLIGGYTHKEAYCAHGSDTNFRQPYTIRTACGNTHLSDNTIAVRLDAGTLACGNSVFFVGETPSGNSIGTTKTVTDNCPACSGHTGKTTGHVDNFTTDDSCSGSSLPNYQAILLGN